MEQNSFPINLQVKLYAEYGTHQKQNNVHKSMDKDISGQVWIKSKERPHQFSVMHKNDY